MDNQRLLVSELGTFGHKNAKFVIFRPPNSYILHCHSKSGLFTLYLKGNDMKNSKFGKS